MMNEQKEGFSPDLSEEYFTIEIKVFKNCQTTSITPYNGRDVTFQEVIGAIEIQRMNIITLQSVENIEHWISKIKEQGELRKKPK